MTMNEKLGTRFVGHIIISDYDTGEIIVDKFNAIHQENMSEAIALSLANRSNGHIHEMVFGNGASAVSGTGAITYFPPNVVGADAQLYNQTYQKVVDDLSPLNLDKTRNRMRVQHVQGTTYSDIIVECVLDFGEPSGQQAFDDATNNDGEFVFDEIGLKGFDSTPGNGKLLTHVIFHPVQKSLNRRLRFLYTVRVFMC